MKLLDVKRGNTTSETINFVLEECCNCGIPFLMPDYLKKRLVAEPGSAFYCPNGHGQHYTGKTEAQKLKEVLEAERARAVAKEQELQNKWLDEMSEKMKLSRELKRVKKGVCPCCNRTFQNLASHMKTKHPDKP